MPTDMHLECWTMLPWLVTGRISIIDRQRAERHLLECEECRIELDEQRRLCEAVRREESVVLAPHASLQALMSRIEASDAPATIQPSIATSVSQPAPSRARAPRWLAIAASIQVFVIAGLLAIVWQQRAAEMSAPRFTTLSNASLPRTDGQILRAVFRKETTNGELQALLSQIDAQVIAGPSEAGVYTLRLPNSVAPPQVDSVLQTLRRDPNTVFAEYVSAEVRR